MEKKMGLNFSPNKENAVIFEKEGSKIGFMPFSSARMLNEEDSTKYLVSRLTMIEDVEGAELAKMDDIDKAEFIEFFRRTDEDFQNFMSEYVSGIKKNAET